MNQVKLFRIVSLVLLSFVLSTDLLAQGFNLGAREWSALRTGASIKTCKQLSTPPTPACDTLMCMVDFYNTPSALGTNFKIK